MRNPCIAHGNVSRQCPNPKYLCSARWQSVLVVPSPCNAEPLSICPCAAKLQYSCSAFAVLQGRQSRGRQEKITFLVQERLLGGDAQGKQKNLVVTGCEPGVVALVFLDMLRGDATSLAFRTLLQTSPQSASSAQLQHRHFFCFFSLHCATHDTSSLLLYLHFLFLMTLVTLFVCRCIDFDRCFAYRCFVIPVLRCFFSRFLMV